MSNPREDQREPISDYQKLHVVGQGAFGIVYLCQRLSDNAQVIMKQIPVEDMTADERKSALDEVKILSQLKHPNVIKHYHNFFDQTALIIIMEYAEGGTMLDLIQKRKGKLIDEKRILQLFAQIVLSLSYIHSQNILHRDIKTSNILLNKKMDVVKIGDFGISKILSSKSKAFSVIGTPSYISPELCQNQPYNQKTDIWALGCILYEMMALKKAFEAHNLPALVMRIMQAVVPPIPEKYDDDIKELLMKLLCRDPNQRPSIREIMAEPLLVNTLMDLPMRIGRPPGVRASVPAASVAAIVPGRARPPQNSITSLSSYLGAEVFCDNKQELPSVVYRWGGGLLKPTVLPLPKDDIQVIQVAIGRTLKAGVTSKGRLLVWETALGGGDIPGSAMKEDNHSAIPRFIDGHAGVSIAQVSCGDMFIACVTDTGILMTFGNGVHGCLGHGHLLDVKQPKIVEYLIGKQIVKISCGAMHVMAVTADHSVFSWGKGDTGRLGHSYNKLCHKPKHVLLPEGSIALSCFCGTDCSAIITDENKVLVCGGNRFNKLALNPHGGKDKNEPTIDEADHFVPITIKPLADLCIKHVALGISHSAFVSENGKCYTCGSNSFGQLGFTRTGPETHPQVVKSLEEKNIDNVTCGDTYTVAVTSDGEIYAWGKAARGRLGTGNEDDSTAPKLVNFQEKLSVVSISSNKGTTMVVTKEA